MAYDRDGRKKMKGSIHRDAWNFRHKQLNRSFWAADADLLLLANNPHSIIAHLDYKEYSYDPALVWDNGKKKLKLEWPECAVISWWERYGVPSFVIIGTHFVDENKNDQFRDISIVQVWDVNPTVCEYRENCILRDITLEQYEKWESEFRRTANRIVGVDVASKIVELMALILKKHESDIDQVKSDILAIKNMVLNIDRKLSVRLLEQDSEKLQQSSFSGLNGNSRN